MAIGLTVAELEHHKTNMNTKEKHIIRSIHNWKCFKCSGNLDGEGVEMENLYSCVLMAS